MVEVLTEPNQAPAVAPDRQKGPFRLILTVKRGVSSDFAATWMRYATLDAARAAAAALARDERVAHIMIVRDEIPPHAVEWAA
jgi:hypothetical protein